MKNLSQLTSVLAFGALAACGATTPTTASAPQQDATDAQIAADSTHLIETSRFIMSSASPHTNTVCQSVMFSGKIGTRPAYFLRDCQSGHFFWGESIPDADAHLRALGALELTRLIRVVEQSPLMTQDMLDAMATASPTATAGPLGLRALKANEPLDTGSGYIEADCQLMKADGTKPWVELLFNPATKLVHYWNGAGQPPASLAEVVALPALSGKDLSDAMGQMYEAMGINMIYHDATGWHEIMSLVALDSLPSANAVAATMQSLNDKLVNIGLNGSVVQDDRGGLLEPVLGIVADTTWTDTKTAHDKVLAILTADKKGNLSFEGIPVAWVHPGRIAKVVQE